MKKTFTDEMKEIMTPRDFRAWRFGMLHPEDVLKYIEKAKAKKDDTTQKAD
jgi:hypothetical protein|tara:strand:+ start:374 stop:526 length:153 start_codon:yes stop_codon:yes gene_type:complete